MEEDGTPGAVVLVRSPTHGDWTSAFGTRTVGADKPVTTDDVFGLGDISQAVTATAILALQRQGKLSLSDPIAKYVAGVPHGDSITLEDLGRYDSGLFDYQQDEQFQKAVAADPGRVWTPQELLAFSFRHPIDTKTVTGARIGYSRTDYVLLGMVLAKVTGRSAADALRALVFDPLGLRSMGLSDGGALPGPHADGHLYAATAVGNQILPEAQRDAVADHKLAPRDISTTNTSWASTAGGVYGTAADTADLLHAMVTAGPVLDQASVDARTAGLEGIGFPDQQGVVYGFGLAKYGQYWLYSGANAGYNSVAAYDPTTGTTIVLLVNLMSEDDGDAPVQALFSAITDAVGPVVVPAE